MKKDKLIKKWFKNPKWPYSSDTITTMTDENGHSVDLAFILGGRNLGKSFEICAKQCLMDAWYSDGEHQFGYIRRNEKELTSYNINAYFADKGEFISDMTDNMYDKVDYYRGALYFARVRFDENGRKYMDRSFPIGYCFALSTSIQYKSLQYPKVNKLLFEEVFAMKYIANESRLLLNLISTVKRDKTDFITYLVANTVSRVNPYVTELCLTKLMKQKPGTIDTYKMLDGLVDEDGNESYYYIAIEYLSDSNTSTKKISTVASTITNEWDEVAQYPVLSSSLLAEYETLYNAVVEYGEFRYLLQIKRVPVNIQDMYNKFIEEDIDIEPLDEFFNVLYVEPKTTSLKPNTRLFTNAPIINPNTTIGFKVTNDQDKLIQELLSIGWVFYSDNLTANEFNECLPKLGRR